MMTTILIWIAAIVGGIVALMIIAVGVLLYLVTLMDEDEQYEIDSFDPHVVDSAHKARSSARIADMPEPMGY